MFASSPTRLLRSRSSFINVASALRSARRFVFVVSALALGFGTPRAVGQSRLTNLSVLSTAGSDGETLIVGFAVGGSGSKPVLIRGIGPSLATFNVTDPVDDPQLKLFSGTRSIAENDDWGGSGALADAFRAAGAFELPAKSRDAVLLETLSGGAYSVHVTAASVGGALVECYDAAVTSRTAYLTNLSARSIVGRNASVLTMGFAISGTEPKPILIRGIGPALTGFGVTDALSRPRLRLFDRDGNEIADATNWNSSVTPPALFTSAGAFPLSFASADAVLFLALPPGTYTAQVSNFGNTPGSALIEAYEVNASPVPFVTLDPVEQSGAGEPDDPGVGTPSAGADTTPRVTFQARPAYPFELRRANVTGNALVDFYVKTDGRVANAVAIRATDTRFAAASVVAVNAWTFIPGRRNGQLVTTHMQVPIIFTLNQ